MKVLVTGGAGFIGSNLVSHLLRKGYEVTVLDNLSSGYQQNLHPFPDIRFVKGDIRDEETVIGAIKGQEIVFHLAASVGNKRSIDDPITDAEINVIGTVRILEAARKYGIKKIITSSSAGIFGELKTIPISENHPAEPDSPYGCTKLCQEKLSLAFAKMYNFDVICLRYFNVYGPNQRFDAYGNVIPIFIFQMLRGQPLTIFGDGEQTRDFLHVADVVQANIKAAESVGVTDSFNIASGTRITINRLVELLKNASGLEPMIKYGPPRLGDVRHSIANITYAADMLGYDPSVTLEVGLKDYYDWAKTEFNN